MSATEQSASSRKGFWPLDREWREGWPILLSCYFGMILGTAPLVTIGLFMGSLTGEFGWGRGEISGVSLMYSGIVGVSAPFAGRLIDRVGTRRVALFGCVVSPLALGCLSLTQSSIYTFWFGWLVIGIAQIFANALVWTIPVARSFARNRGLALAIMFTSSATFSVIYPVIAVLLIQNVGWRLAYVFTAAGLFLLVTPFVFAFLRDTRTPAAASSPASESGEPLSGLTLREAAGTRQFWQMAVMIIFSATTVIGLFVHFVPMLIDGGLTPLQAATAASFYGISSFAVKLIVGYLLDRVDPARLGAMVLIGPVLASIALLIGVDSLVVACIVAIGIGLVAGAELDLIGYLSARYFGLAHYGQILGVMIGLFQIGLGIGPLLAGAVYDLDDSYARALKGMMVLLVASAVLLFTMGRPPREYASRH